jgi:cytochrome c peroxidase
LATVGWAVVLRWALGQRPPRRGAERRLHRPTGSLLVTLLSALLAAAPAAAPVAASPLGDDEREAILRHGPWPPARAQDPGNPLSGRREAERLGQWLFFDAALSPSGRVACATCHLPGLQFADGRARASGLAELARHTPSLWNAVHQRWQGWDGGADSLWAQAIRPLLDPAEMGGDAVHLQRRIVADTVLSCRWQRATGVSPAPPTPPETVLVGTARALGAFVATLQSPRTPFDDFRDALARGDRPAQARYPAAALRGLRLFVGRGNCAVCHQGPLFTHGEFADIGLPFFVRPGVVDSGRHGGIEQLQASPYTRLSPWAVGADATPIRHLHPQHRNFGEFKVPSLRGVADTPPYMHDGQLPTLERVIAHYSSLNEERLHADGERILRPLNLSDAEQADLLAFLRTLSPRRPVRWQPLPVPPCR